MQQSPNPPEITEAPTRSFLILRLLLATSVVFFHSFVLGGFSKKDIIELITNGRVNGGIMIVRAFFIVSGFLLTLSLLKNPSLPRFCIRRFFRIMPGYWACLTVTTFLVVPLLFHTLTKGYIKYFDSIIVGSQPAIEYWMNNLLLMIQQNKIPPIFKNNPYPLVVNGSLWTLFYEAFCYAIMAGAAFIGIFKKLRYIAIPFALLLLTAVIHSIWSIPTAQPSVVGMVINCVFHPGITAFGLAFSGGAVAAIVASKHKFFNPWIFLIAIILIVITAPFKVGLLIWPITLPYIIISISEWSVLERFEKLPDLSYGVYLYGFLLQQCLVMMGYGRYGAWTFIFCSIILSYIAGALSFYLFEKPAIHLGERLFKHQLERIAAPTSGRAG